MYLAINMSQARQIHLVLFGDTKTVETTDEGANADVLAVLAAFLSSAKVAATDLTGIAVVMAEGTFTSTRLSATVANTFQYVHGTPLLAIASSELADTEALAARFTIDAVDHFLSVTYSAEPRIGKKK